MKFWKALLYFCIGGSAYISLELLWRGRSHYTMFLAGGLCFLLLGKLSRKIHNPLLQGLAGAGVITSVELLTGILANRNFTIWDYRSQPMNLWGQICLPFFALWIPLSLGAMLFYKLLDAVVGQISVRKFSNR